MTATKHLKFTWWAQSPPSSADCWQQERSGFFSLREKFPLFLFMHLWQAGSSKATFVRPGIFIVHTLTFKVENLLAKITQPVSQEKKPNPHLDKAKDKATNPPRLPSCLCHTLCFKMLGHQLCSVKCVQLWLHWAISCYWNLLFRNYGAKASDLPSSPPCHTACLGTDHLVTSTERKGLLFCTSGKAGKGH